MLKENHWGTKSHLHQRLMHHDGLQLLVAMNWFSNRSWAGDKVICNPLEVIQGLMDTLFEGDMSFAPDG